MAQWGNNSVVLHEACSQRWWLFRNPLKVLVAHTVESVMPVLRTVEQQVNVAGLYAAGFITYEAAPAFDRTLTVRSQDSFPLAWFGLYSKPEPISLPSPLGNPATDLPWRLSVSQTEYRLSIQKIKEYIRRGDTYQVNYSFRLRTPFPEDPWKYFVQMIHAQGNHYGAFVNTQDWTICSASPELFFSLENRRLISRPMKGTVSRGLGYADDLQRADWLRRSEKNQAENVMIVDMVRNDLGRIADVGSVRVRSLFEVEKYPTLWQLTSTVHCTTSAGIADVFRALFPPASITGAPKSRTMQIIAELENAPRRIYTGTIGFVTPQHTAQFNVAIRTVLVDRLKKLAEYGVGGGIVWDSEEYAELQECHTKAKILTQMPPDFALLETLLWTPDKGYFLLDRHLNRLADSAAYFSYSVDIGAIRDKLRILVRDLPPLPHRIRLLAPNRKEAVVESHPVVQAPRPYSIAIAKRSINSSNPFLYHKTTHRAVYEQALAESPGYDDVLLWNERNQLTESCIANVAVEKEGRLLTPPVDCGLLPGTYRSLLLEQGKITEQIISVRDLQRCSRIYLFNSVRGMWEVSVETLGGSYIKSR